jgi:hypothetical protein
VVWLADQVSEVDGPLGLFTSWNQPKGAVLLMDSDPLQLAPGRSFVGRHLKVNRQLPECISKSTANFQNAFFPPGMCPSKILMTVP